MGEQLCKCLDCWNYVGAADVQHPDVWKAGSITEFLKISTLGAAKLHISFRAAGNCWLTWRRPCPMPSMERLGKVADQ